MRPRSAVRSNPLAAIVLAAGGSSRLGRPKQLLRAQGTPLLLRAVRLAARAVDGPVIVVLGAERQRLRSLVRRRAEGARGFGKPRGVTIVANPAWDTGLASSLRAGLARVPTSAPAVLILLVDQPGIGAADLSRLIVQWQRKPRLPAAAGYSGRAGVPAILPRRLFGHARGLEGDVGARVLLRDSGELTRVEMGSAAFDVDTPEDAARLNPTQRSHQVRASRN